VLPTANVSRAFAAILIAGGLAGCSKPASPTPPTTPAQNPATSVDFAPPRHFTATLLDTPTVRLRWEIGSPHTDGYFVEYQNPGDDSFVILDITHRDATTFEHPDLAPETKFIYRVRPYFGKASEVVTITTGQAPPAGTPNLEEEGPVEESAQTSSPDKAGKSIRTLATMTEAAPSKFAVSLSSPTSVILRWKDNASDEDGFLVECAVDLNQAFKICALLPPNTVSFKKIMLPGDTKCTFRVRAFFYGEPTPLADVTTPPEKRAAEAGQVSKPGG
jgi:Fibronectin type III domain